MFPIIAVHDFNEIVFYTLTFNNQTLCIAEIPRRDGNQFDTQAFRSECDGDGCEFRNSFCELTNKWI